MIKRKKSGLDIDLGNRCSQIAYKWAKKTFANREGRTGKPLQEVDGTFAGMIQAGKNRIGISSDGIGTKIELAERTGIYKTIAHDLVAMVVDDLAANGFEPCCISNILDVDLLQEKVVDELMQGLVEAANIAGISITGGEIAELGSRIAGFGKNMHFNWGATGLGILPENLKQPIDGKKVKSGDVVLTLKSNGFRSNGFSLIRRIMQKQFGKNWHTKKYVENKTWGEILLTPSLIFTPLVNLIIKKKVIPHAIVHITGGGLPDNLLRVLKPNQLGAELTDIYPPQEFVLKLQNLGQVEEKEAYKLWNMGNGMLLIVDPKNQEKIMELSTTTGYQIKAAGIVKETNKITVKTKGVELKKLIYKINN